MTPSRSLGATSRLVCIVEEYAATLATVITECEEGERGAVRNFPGLGGRAQVELIESVLADALGVREQNLSARRRYGLQLAARQLIGAFGSAGDLGTTTIAIGGQL